MKNTKFYNRAKFFLFSILSMFTYTVILCSGLLGYKNNQCDHTNRRMADQSTLLDYWNGVILIIIIAIIASRGRRKDD
jgi:hypothetical protein